MRRVKSTVLMSLTGVLLLAGCGGESGATHPFARPVTAIDPADQARAEAMLITSADLPVAWNGEPHVADHDRNATCVDGTGMTEIGNAYSDEFARTDASYDIHAQNQAIVFASEDQARTWLEGVRDDAVPACVKRNFTKAQKEDPDPGVEINVTSAGTLRVADVGDESFGIRLTVDVTQAGRTTPVYLDYVFVRVGDAVSVLSLINAREPFDQTEQRSQSPTTADLADVIANRMESARAS
jgi:hypothetical protein